MAVKGLNISDTNDMKGIIPNFVQIIPRQKKGSVSGFIERLGRSVWI